MAPSTTPTAAVLLIGDELLSGKVRDENGHALATWLRRRGIRLIEICVVGDAPDEIAAAFLRLCARAPLVFTSGGVGPTHDDRTLASIAAATDRALVRHPEMEAQLRAYYGERITEAALHMADVPQGTQLRAMPGWPVLRLDLPQTRVYILPGVPSLLRAKLEHLEAIEGEVPHSDGWHLAVLYTSLDESKLATHLDAIVAAHPGIDVGSYPRWSRGGDGRIHMHVRVTLEAPRAHADEVDAARDRLAAALPPGAVLEHEPPV
jgi:molybdenum cofactor synthesis domain-containing protein